MHAIGSPARLLAGLIIPATCPRAEGQATAEGRRSVGIKVGANHEQAEDGLRGTASAGGISVGFPINRSWSGEVELWVPAFIRNANGDPRHRDIQASFSMVRYFGAGRVRPYLLAGASIARTDERFTTCIADRVPLSSPGSGLATPTIVACSESDVRERRHERFGSTPAYVLGGAGFEVALGPRLRLATEIRVHAAPTSVIVRPSAAVLVLF